MDERHGREQYFFDEATLTDLAEFIEGYDRPFVVFAPMLGKRLVERGTSARVLDVDDRFADLSGFRSYDVESPEWLGEAYGLIVCDPPFFNVSLKVLFAALRTLSRNDFAQRMVVFYLSRRAAAFERAFEPFGLKRTGYVPGYATVESVERNRIEAFSNLDESGLRRLRAKNGGSGSG